MAYFADRLGKGEERPAPDESTIFMDTFEKDGGGLVATYFVPEQYAAQIIGDDNAKEAPRRVMRVGGKDVTYVTLEMDGAKPEHAAALGRKLAEDFGVNVELFRARIADGTLDSVPRGGKGNG